VEWIDRIGWALALGLLLGAGLVALWLSARHKKAIEQWTANLAQAHATASSAEQALSRAQALLDERSARLLALEQRLGDEQAERARINALLTESQTRLDAERREAEQKLALLQSAREELSAQFKTLAHEILEDKSRRFTEQNQLGLGQLLEPLRERIADFRSKVEEIHRHDTEQQAMLRTELQQLKGLNQQLSAEAQALTTALSGQVKTQGNWGELILGNVLERAGLVEGRDYKREVSFDTEDGRKRPDVIVYLPQNRHLVIDAKVSLNAYTRYVNAESDEARRLALREHLQAIGQRIRELSARDYFDLPGLNSPEVVFMFIPVESAFVEALRADATLLESTINRNILVATPTTLLTSLNIVRQLWRFEQQNRHSAELADRAARVHQKLRIFLESMQSLGKQLETARGSYDKAINQLVSGRGNLISQVQEFEQLGVAVQSALPEDLVSRAGLAIDWEADQPSDRQPMIDTSSRV
jgi:DNA recombination protein RmuC